MRPTFDELRTYWLLAYSRASLLEADELLNAMETARPKSIELRAIISAAVMLMRDLLLNFRLRVKSVSHLLREFLHRLI